MQNLISLVFIYKMDNESLETILRNKINELSHYLKSFCNNDDQVNLIEHKLNNLKYYEIMLFILSLKESEIETYINQFINTYKIHETEQIRNTIKEYLQYFISVNNLLKETVK